MKIALYIEDGLEQIVLTPESETEEGILGKLHDGSRVLSIKRGDFYACQGGWTRHSKQSWTSSLYSPSESGDGDSTMIVLREMRDVEPDSDPVDAIVREELAKAYGAAGMPGTAIGFRKGEGSETATFQVAKRLYLMGIEKGKGA